MNFGDEHYVRIYTRDTKTWLKWGWEGQAVFLFVMRKLDKAGMLDDIDEPISDISLMTGLPEEVVSIGLNRVISSGALELVGSRMICPNYVEAQSARKSDRARQQESRAKRAAEARVTSVTSGHDLGQSVTKRDSESQNVTVGHDLSHDVTPSHTLSQMSPSAVQCSAVQRSAVQSRGVGGNTGSDEPAPPKTQVESDPPKRQRAKPKRPLPDDWAPAERHQAKADELGVNIQTAAEKFRAHAGANDRRQVDWDKAFDMWLLNEPTRNHRLLPQNRTQTAFDPFERVERLRREENAL